jgi:integrase
MASIIRDPGGTKRIQFIEPAIGRRRAVRLGKMSVRDADVVKSKIEAIVAAKAMGRPVDLGTAEWVGDLSNEIHARFAKVGLFEPRENAKDLTLSTWSEKYIEQRSTELAKESVRKLRDTSKRFDAFFGHNRQLSEITPSEAADWRAGLLTSGLKEATVRGHCRNAKTIFNEAVTREMIPTNPFRALKSSAIASNRDHYVTPEEAEQVVEACPDVQWRLFFGLMRYAGLRAPSETHALTWDCVDWEKMRLSVYAPKTKQTRIVPIDPRMYEILSEADALARTGQKRLITRSRRNLHRDFKLILRRASIAPWEDLFQTLRRSCETEWAIKHPQHAVSKWIGHSMAVSERHYLQIPDSLYDAVSLDPKSGAKSGAVHSRNGVQETANAPNDENGPSPQETRKPALCFDLQHNAGSCEVGRGGLEPPTPGFSVPCSTN